MQGAPHKVLAKLGRVANQLAAAKCKGVEIAAKLQVSHGASKPAQLTSPHQESDKPSNRSSVPVDFASAPGNISAACGLPALVSVSEDTTTSNVGQVESVSTQVLLYKDPISYLTVLRSLSISPLFWPALWLSDDCLFLLAQVCNLKCLP